MGSDLHYYTTENYDITMRESGNHSPRWSEGQFRNKLQWAQSRPKYRFHLAGKIQIYAKIESAKIEVLLITLCTILATVKKIQLFPFCSGNGQESWTKLLP
jgi:hypothetical protein